MNRVSKKLTTWGLRFSFKPSVQCFSTRDTIQSKTHQSKKPATESLEEIRKIRIEKLNKLKELGLNPFEYTFSSTHSSSQLQELFKTLPNGAEDNSRTVSLAGRVMLKRIFGKLAFFEVHDESGSIQFYCEKNRLGDSLDNLKNLVDTGDIIGATGTLKRTDKGELSIYVSEWKMLTKSLLPLPDKFHGLTDTNLRYRHRHLDLIVNPQVRETFRSRAKITASIRRQLDQQGFLEIETPILNTQPGGADAKPFQTYHNSLEMPLTLRIATELHLKRLVVGGLDRVYEIGRIFRNEGLSSRHNPEFTSIELYQAYADYEDLMRLTEEMVSTLSMEVRGSTLIPYQGQSIDLGPPWRRVSMSDLVKEMAPNHPDFDDLILRGDLVGAKQASLDAGVSPSLVAPLSSPGTLLNLIFEEICEKQLIQPTFVIDHPVEISPLSKPHRHKGPHFVERFELFVVGRELANAFSELTDPLDQRRRFEIQAQRKEEGDENACGVDEEFLHALETGMPPTAGLGIGIDRLVMLLTDSPTIKDVIAFPLLKPDN